MSERESRGSVPPTRAFRIAGARLPLVVALLSAGGVVVAGGAAYLSGAVSGRRVEVLEEEFADHQTAGEMALAALDEAKDEADAGREAVRRAKKEAALHRARELALFLTHRASSANRRRGRAALGLPESWKPGAGERVGLVDPARDRVVAFEGLRIAEGATLSASLPALADAMRRQPTGEMPYTFADEEGVWAVGPKLEGGRFGVAHLDASFTEPATPGAIARARRLIGAFAAPAPNGEGAGKPWPFFLAAAVLVGGIGALWAHRRLTAPIADALEVVRDFVHGRSDVRADPERGGRDAREIAMAINALIERAERAMERGRAAHGDDTQNAVLVIERLGRGDLRDSVVDPERTTAPIAEAIERARRELLERVTEMHQVTLEVARRASELVPAARRVAESGAEQHAALTRLGVSSEDGVEQIQRKAVELEQATALLQAHAQEHRRAIQEVRASLSGLSRRVMALRGAAEDVQALSARAESIDQALSMLSRLAGQSDVPATRSRASALVGDARGALGEIGDRLDGLSSELIGAAHGLELMAQSQPEPPGELDAGVTRPFYDAVSILVRTVELTVGSLGALERAAKSQAENGDAILQAGRDALELVPRLGTALSAIRLGTSFEEQLLARLERMRAEVSKAESEPGRLTPEGERMVAEVLEASQVARAKLARLVHATETAIDAIRG